MTPFRMNEIPFMIFAMHFIMESPPFDLYSPCYSHDYTFEDWLRCNHPGFSHRIEGTFANDQVIEN